VRSFGSNGYLLSDARLEIRLVYSGFLVLVAIGLATMAIFQVGHIGPGPAAIAAYYRGGERGATMLFPKTARELVEVTHFHAFIMGIVYLVMAHLLVATRAPEPVKRAAIVLGFVGLAGDIAAAWLVRYVAAGFAYLLLAAWAAEWAAFGAFIYYPLREMWFSSGRDFGAVD
jgi:hypothetical protein